MQAIILAGGEGRRMLPLTEETPKLLLPLNGMPLIEHFVKLFRAYNIKDVIICTGHLSDKIEEYISKKDYGLNIKISRESEPLGTAGPLNLIKDNLQEKFFILFGDIYADIDLGKMLRFHEQKNADVTLVIHESNHPGDSTIVSVDKNSKITNFLEKPGEEWIKYGNLTSTSIYLVKKDIINFIEANKKLDLSKEVFPLMLKNNKNLYGYKTEEYIKDTGTLERHEEVEKYLALKKIAVFLDRDGVINEEVDLLTKPEQIKIIKGAAEGIKLLNQNGILAIITTNQPVVARNLITEEELKIINKNLLDNLEKEGAHVDAVYYCPHHPEKNHPEASNPKYRIECDCRKPKTGMIKEATKSFKINVNDSYVIGDRTVDIQFGKNAGCKTILVKTGYGGKDNKYNVTADHCCNDLLNACKLIISLGEKR